MASRRRYEVGDMRAEINLTPMVDFALNLLIIFMISAPLMKEAFNVNLPEATAQNNNVEQEEAIILSIARDGKIAVNRDEIPREELPLALTTLYQNRIDKTLFIEADANAAYQKVITAMDLARKMELKMSLLYEPEQSLPMETQKERSLGKKK